jgi:hypothetical protein
MDFLLLLEDQIRFFDSLKDDKPNLNKLLTMLSLAAICFGLMRGADYYLVNRAEVYGLLDNINNAIKGDLGPAAATEDTTQWLIGRYKSAAVTEMLGISFGTLIGAGLLFLILKILGSNLRYAMILRASVYLFIFPLIICSFSAFLNIASYAILGSISWLNFILVPAIGWIFYCVLLGEWIRDVSGLSKNRNRIVLSAIGLMIASIVLGAFFELVYWYWLVPYVVDKMFANLGL